MTRLSGLVFLVAAMAWSQAPTDCSVFDTAVGPITTTGNDAQQHSVGDHYWVNEMSGYCTYTGQGSTAGPTACQVTGKAHSVTDAGESQGAATGIWHHGYNIADKDQQADGNAGGTSPAVQAEGAAGVVSCAILPCGINVAINGGGYGGSYSVSYSPTPIWAKQTQWINPSCLGHTLPTETACTPTAPPPYSVEPPEYWYWDTSSCQYVVINGQSPVVIDTSNKGFKFTDPKKGNYVTFDLHGDGTYEKLSWTKQDSGNMWLVLPDANGQVTNGKELFGNYTPHSDGGVLHHPNPNGFLALAWYDKPSNGGDGNALIDAKDAVWAKLRLWDATRCLANRDTPCVSNPNELYALDSKGIHSISLAYGVVNQMPAKTPMMIKNGQPVWGNMGAMMDLAGNQYKFYTLLNPEAENNPADDKGNVCCALHQKSQDGRWAVDIFLTSIK